MRNKEQKIVVIISIVLTILLSIVAFCFSKISGIICLVLGLGLSLMFLVSSRKRYKKIGELNSYLSQVLSGDYSLNIALNTEGELSILENNLLKVITNLKASNEAVRNDKIYLADSLADISHQLKTPLTSMMVITDLLRYEQEQSKRQEFVGIIENQCEKMNWLIANLLKLSKLDAGTVEFTKTDVAVSSLVEQSTKPFELALDLKNIELKLDIDDYTLAVDKNWLAEAIKNIIKNCIEHTAENGTIKITTVSRAVYNEIIIEDNGCGIEKEDLPHIFERFYHGKNSSSDSVGIGLALAKEIVCKHSGVIEAESEIGKGTKFSIKLYKTIV